MVHGAGQVGFTGNEAVVHELTDGGQQPEPCVLLVVERQSDAAEVGRGKGPLSGQQSIEVLPGNSVGQQTEQ